MRELTYVAKQKEKRTYQLEDGEFQKGEWCKLIPSGKRVEVTFTSANNILIIDNTPYIKFKEAEKAQGDKNDDKDKY